MSVLSRYKFLKKVYPNKLIIFESSKGYKTCEIDKLVFDYVFPKKQFYKIRLEEKHISYIIINNISVVTEYDDDNNLYNKFVYLSAFKSILNKIG